jgi:hypothetical protein
MPELDELAEIYDETRGGEARGEEYAADVTARLPAGEDPVLEVGVGTGVVALGLVRRGHRSRRCGHCPKGTTSAA